MPDDPHAPPTATLLPFTAQHGRAWQATRAAPWVAPATSPEGHRVHDARAPTWRLGLQVDAAPSLDFTAWAHPVLAVPCPTCGRRAGARCVRPSGHQASDLHAARRALADRAFVDKHGPKASVELVDDTFRTASVSSSIVGSLPVAASTSWLGRSRPTNE